MKVNGKALRLEQRMTLAEFLTAQQFDARLIAVEHNGQIVPKTDYDSILLADEDILEIVRFVGGG